MITIIRHHFKLLILGLLSLFFILLCIRLGFWQWHRAAEKQEMITAQQLLSKQAYTDWRDDASLPPPYKKIRITGTYLSQTMLLDNQFNQHALGYDVLSALETQNGKIILIDRGWISGDITRKNLPSVDIPSGKQTIHGSVYYPNTKNWLFGSMIDHQKTNRVVVESVDTKLISQLLQKTLYPFIIRLDKNEANGYVREWPVVAMAPERHKAYALQWFAIALMVVMLSVWFIFKEIK